MSTMEQLLMQIFDRKNWIESQLKHQVESHTESWAYNLLSQGKQPPEWLWPFELKGSVNQDPKGLNREQLISAMSLPLPSYATPSASNTYFTLPTLIGNTQCQPNNMEIHASDKHIFKECVGITDPCRSKQNPEMIAQSKGVEDFMELDHGHNNLEIPPGNNKNSIDMVREESDKEIYASSASNVNADNLGPSLSMNSLIHHENAVKGRVTRSRSRSAVQSNCLESVDKLSEPHKPLTCIEDDVHKVAEIQAKTLISSVGVSNINGNTELELRFDIATNVNSSLKLSHGVTPLLSNPSFFEPKKLLFDSAKEHVNENSHILFKKKNLPSSESFTTHLEEVMHPVSKDSVCSNPEEVNVFENDNSEHRMDMDIGVTNYDTEQNELELIEIEKSENHSHPTSGHQNSHQSINRKSFSESGTDKQDSAKVKDVQHVQTVGVDCRTLDALGQSLSMNSSMHQENADRGTVTRSRSTAQSNSLESLDKLAKPREPLTCIEDGVHKVAEVQIKTHLDSDSFSNINGSAEMELRSDTATNVNSGLKLSHDVASLLVDTVPLIEPKNLPYDGTKEHDLNENSQITFEKKNQLSSEHATEHLDEVMRPANKDSVCDNLEEVIVFENDMSEHRMDADVGVTNYNTEQNELEQIEVENSENHSHPTLGCQNLHQSAIRKSFFENLADKQDSTKEKDVQHVQMIGMDCRTLDDAKHSTCESSEKDALVINSFINLGKENMTSSSYGMPDTKASRHDISEAIVPEIMPPKSNNLHSSMLPQSNFKISSNSIFNSGLEYSGPEVVISDCSKKLSLRTPVQYPVEVESGKVIKADLALASHMKDMLLKADSVSTSSFKNTGSNINEKTGSCKLNGSFLPSSDNKIARLSIPSIVNGSTISTRETNVSKISNISRDPHLLWSSTSPHLANDSRTCTEANLLLVETNINDKLTNGILNTPNKKESLTSSAKARYSLRSLSNNDENDASSNSNMRNYDSHSKQDTEVVSREYEISWPKRRKAHHRSNNIHATSPRLRYQPTQCIKVGSDSMAGFQLPSISSDNNTEAHSTDFEGCSHLKGNNQTVGDTDKWLKSYLKDELKINEATVCETLTHNTSENCHDALHINTTSVNNCEEFTKVQEIHEYEPSSHTPSNSKSPDYDETMPEYEGFNVILPSVVVDDTILNNSNLSIDGKERISLLEQLCKSRNVTNLVSCPSSTHKIHRVPDVYQSLSNMEQLMKTGNNDFKCDFDGYFVRRPYSYSMPYSSTTVSPKPRKLPSTPPVIKFNQKAVSGRSGASSEKVGSNPELVCFRIAENSSIIDENENANELDAPEENSSPKIKMEPFITKDLIDNAVKNKNKMVADRDSIQSVVTKASAHASRGKGYTGNRRSKMEDKENVDITASNKFPVRKAALSLHSRSSKPIISGKITERSRSNILLEKGFEPSNIVSNISSFIPLVHRTPQAAAPSKGRKDVKVKALEAAEVAKRLEDKKQNEREMRKAAAKLERERIEQENIRQLELKQKQKEEEKKKKEAAIAARKRQREEEKEKEQKRRCFGKTQRQKEKMEKMSQLKAEGEKDQRKETIVEDTKVKLLKASEMQQIIINVGAVHNRNERSIPQNSACYQKSFDNEKVVSKSEGSQEVLKTMISVNNKHQNVQSYELSSYKDSDEEDVEEELKRERKCIPLWAR